MKSLRLLILVFIMSFGGSIIAETQDINESIVVTENEEDWGDVDFDLDGDELEFTLEDIENIPESEMTWRKKIELLFEAIKYEAGKAKRGVASSAQKTREHIEANRQAYALGLLTGSLALVGIWYYFLKKSKGDSTK